MYAIRYTFIYIYESGIHNENSLFVWFSLGCIFIDGVAALASRHVAYQGQWTDDRDPLPPTFTISTD